MSWRRVGILWAVATVLVITAIVWEGLAPASGVGAAPEPKRVFAVDGEADTISVDESRISSAPAWPDREPRQLELTRGDDAPLVFVRADDGSWAQSAPIAHPVDPVSMQRTIRAMRELRAVDVLVGSDVGLDDASLGLDPPRATLAVQWGEDEASRRAVLELGRTGIGGRAYARIAGDDRILVVGGDLHARAVWMDPREWRDRSIFGDVAVDTATSVAMRSGPVEVRLERDRRTWRLASPFQTRAAGGPLDELLRSIAAARVAGFVLDAPEDLASFGLAVPVATVEVSVRPPGAETDRTTVLRLGATAGAGSEDRFGLVEGRDVVVRVPGSLIAAIVRNPIDWASPIASGVRAPDVGRVRILATGREIVLERDGAGWTRAVGVGSERPSDPVAIEPAAPSRLLDLVTEVRAAALQPGRVETPIVTLVLEDFSASPLGTVRIGRGDRGTWLMDSGDGLIRVYAAGIEPPVSPDEFPLLDPSEAG